MTRLRQYIEDHFDKINGHFYRPDAQLLILMNGFQHQLGVSGDICELGVFEGKSFVFLSLLLRSNEHLVGYDLFANDSHKIVEANLELYGNLKNVSLLAADTTELTTGNLVKPFMGGIRILHVDAGHEYHEVLYALNLFSQFVAHGGLICMDDYQDREFPGVAAAVLEFCSVHQPRRFQPFFSGINKMYLCEASLAATYQRLILNDANLCDACRVTRIRDFDVLIGFSRHPRGHEDLRREIGARFIRKPETGLEVNVLQQEARNFGAKKQI